LVDQPQEAEMEDGLGPWIPLAVGIGAANACCIACLSIALLRRRSQWQRQAPANNAF